MGFFSGGGSSAVTIGTTAITGGTTGKILFDSAATVGEAGVYASANLIEQYNTTTAQKFSLFNTRTDASNYERAVFDWTSSANVLTIGTENAGAGVARNLRFVTGGTLRMDYGVTQAGTLTVQGAIVANAGTVVASAFSGNPYTVGSAGSIYAGATGIFTFYNVAQNGWDRLQLGGTTSAFPAISRDGAGIKIVAADNTNVSWIKIPPVTVASLPAAATAGNGARSHVTDALAPTFGATVTGGGAVSIPVYSDGTNWKVG